ncbi:hypothetical protein ABK040_016042 [Willaertia magna]
MKSLIICLLIAILFAITFVTATTSNASSSSYYYGEKTINSLLTELKRIKKWKRQQQVNVNNNLSDRRGFGGFRAPTRRPSFRPRPRPVDGDKVLTFSVHPKKNAKSKSEKKCNELCKNFTLGLCEK